MSAKRSECAPPLKLHGANSQDFGNSVHIEGLKELEWLLSGPVPYQGLRPPNWPSVFPALDDKKVARGGELYKLHCEACHLPSAEELAADLQKPQPIYWRENSQKKRFLIVKDVKQSFVGTDPHEATDFMNRTADSGDLGKGRISAGVGLELVTNGIVNKFFDKMKFTPAQQIEWRGYRDPHDPIGARGADLQSAAADRNLGGLSLPTQRFYSEFVRCYFRRRARGPISFGRVVNSSIRSKSAMILPNSRAHICTMSRSRAIAIVVTSLRMGLEETEWSVQRFLPMIAAPLSSI